MKTLSRTVVVVALLALAGCGGGSSGSGDETSQDVSASDDAAAAADSGSSGGGEVVDPQPAGQAIASVDGLEFTFDTPGGLECSIDEESITFSFRIGDNEVTLGGGANKYDSGWLGSIDLVVADPESEPGPVQYFPDLQANGDSGLAFDDDSMSYSGPMEKQPANDGSLPEPVAVGDGTISVTCS